MKHLSLADQMDLVEQQFNEASGVLVDGDPEQIERASATLQRLAIELVQIMGSAPRGGGPVAPMRERLQALSDGVAVLRTIMLRRTAYVEQALQVVVPTVPDATYANSRGTYGPVLRQSGAFKVLAA